MTSVDLGWIVLKEARERARLDPVQVGKVVLGDVLRAGSGQNVARHFLSLLKDARSHFAAEEKLLDRHGYPDLEAHCAEHSRLLAESTELHMRYVAGTISALSLPSFLKEWLRHHIVTADRVYSVFLRSKGIVDGHQLILPPELGKHH